MQRAAPAQGPYVGRTGLRASLARALEATQAGGGTLVLLTGDPGSGKSASLEWLRGEASQREMAFCLGRCAELEGAPAFLPWDEVVREVLDESAQATAPVADEAGAFRRMREITDALLEAARNRPLVVAIDDLHAADAASVRLLAYAAREAGRAPLLLVAAGRPELAAAGHAHARLLADVAALATPLELAPLSSDDAASLTAALVGRELPRALSLALCEQGAGNPLFLRQLVGMLLAEELDLDDPRCLQRVAGMAPLGLRQVVAERLDGLEPPLREALALGALLGRRFDPALLAAAWREHRSAELPRLESAAAAGILEPSENGSFFFAHALLREGLLASLAAEELAAQHAVLARVLEAQAPAEGDPLLGMLAHHALAADGGFSGAAAAEWAARAAADALRRHAQEEALDWCDRALQRFRGEPQAGQGQTLGHLLVLRGQARWRCGHNERAREDFAAAGELGRRLEDGELEAEAAVGFTGRTDVSLGVSEESTSRLNAARHRLADTPSRLRVEVLTLLATGQYFASDRARCEEPSLAAVDCAEATGDPATLAYALTGRHFLLMRPGRLEERRTIGERALRAAVAGDDAAASALARFGSVCDALEAGDLAAADRHVAAYGVIAERLRQPFLLWQHRAMRATRALAAGRLGEAESLAGEAARLGEEAGSPNAQAVHAAHLFGVRRSQGRLAELAPLITGLGEALPSMSSFAYARAEILLAAGHEEEARSFLRAASAEGFSDVPDDFNWPAAMSIAARLCVALDDQAAAASAYEVMRPLDGGCVVLGLGNVWEGAISLHLGRLAAAIGSLDRAYAHLADAEDLHARVGARLLLAETWAARADLFERGGDPDSARSLLARAGELRRELGLAQASGSTETGDGEPRAEAPDASGADVARWGRTRDGRWRLQYAGGQATLPDSRGLTYLAELLARPGEPVHVLDLISRVAPDGAVAQPESGGMDVLDERARREYRECIEGLREQCEEAEARGDSAGAERARVELEALEDALASALGLGGRSRRTGDPVERARKAVYNRVRDAFKRVEEDLPELAAHLRAGVRTGRVCVYAPDHPVAWLLPAGPESPTP